MSSLVITYTMVTDVKPHPNADLLELTEILGWQAVNIKGDWKVGDPVVYFPPDTVLSFELSELFNVTKYLSKGRIRQIKLRGEPSFGLGMKPELVPGFDPSWEIGSNVAEFIEGVSKYEPPVRELSGDELPSHPLLTDYTDIENLRNYPGILQDGELIYVSEKIHGASVKIGIIEGEVMAGSHHIRRKRPEDDDKIQYSRYWYPYSLPSVRSLLESYGSKHKQVILYGEVYGPGIQSLGYGVTPGKVGFRAFDIRIDGKYQDYVDFVASCTQFGIDMVPLLYVGLYSLEKVRELSRGSTTFGVGHIREGVVVRPLLERHDPKVGRVIMKYLNDDYLFSKGISDYLDV